MIAPHCESHHEAHYVSLCVETYVSKKLFNLILFYHDLAGCFLEQFLSLCCMPHHWGAQGYHYHHLEALG